IRDKLVTGVQTCALPICEHNVFRSAELEASARYIGSSAALYFTQYPEIARAEDLRAEAGWVDGVAAIAVFRPASSIRPAYFIRKIGRASCRERVESSGVG